MAPPGEMGTPARNSYRQSLQQDDDEYDLEALGGISDGFRYNPSPPPPQQQQTAPLVPEVSQVELPPPRRHSSLIQSQFNNTNPPPRPSSISKPKFAPDAFALRHDGAMGPLANVASSGTPSPPNNSNQSSLLSRASSVSTVSTQSTLMRAEGPYQGPSGPSFPYQMYPQNTRLARTMSVATTSTAAAPPERPYEGPAAPTHPYGMYPQSITPDAQEGLPAAAIPVGFPGLNNDYQRRLGPEGEEAADLIGPDGHTEQLPPYTQYPDDAVARKVRGVVVPALVVGSAVEAGAGGLGIATRNPEFDSPRDEAHSPLNADRNSVVSRGSSQQTVLNAGDSASEKPPLKHWQIVAKRKVCGIVPIWVFVLMAITILLMVAILAGVLTALKPKKHHNVPGPDGAPGPESETSPQTTVYSTVTTTFDAKSTTVPSSFPTLPTGTFGLMLGAPDDTQTDCIHNSAQLNAWQCTVPPVPISINISTVNNRNTALLSTGQNIASWNYGTQPPIVDTQKTLDLVIDVENQAYGPAWFFQVPYNKLVVLHQSQLTVSTSSSGKRQASFNPPAINPSTFNPSTSGLNRKAPAQPGDQPWFCYWNGTLLETFIFANQTSAAGAQEDSSASATATSTSSAYSSSTSSSVWASPTTRLDRRRQVVSGSFPASPQISGEPTFLSGYPKIVKIEERRIPEGSLTTPPYCVSMTINSDGSFTANTNSSGLPIQIELNETDPTMSQMNQKRGYADLSERNIAERSDVPGDCSCVWMAT